MQERARRFSALPPAQRLAVLNVGLDGQYHRFGALAGEQYRLDVGTTGLPERLEAVHSVDDGHGPLVNYHGRQKVEHLHQNRDVTGVHFRFARRVTNGELRHR